jgi:hypothetical protein
MRLLVTRYISGEPIYHTNDIRISISKDGLPNRLPEEMINIVKNFNNNPKNLRLLLTMLSLSRALKGSEYKPDLSDITDPFVNESGNTEYNQIITLIPSVLAIMDLPKIPRPQFREYHLSTKSGIFSSAMHSALVETKFLPQSLIDSIKVVGGDELVNRISLLKDLNNDQIIDQLPDGKLKNKYTRLLEGGNVSMRKLSLVHAPERKSRIIAIFDYWSQTSLKPLHDRLMKMLMGIEQDCTFKQVDKKKVLPAKPGVRFHSLDLKSATDRFPIEVIKMIISHIVDHEYATH